MNGCKNKKGSTEVIQNSFHYWNLWVLAACGAFYPDAFTDDWKTFGKVIQLWLSGSPFSWGISPFISLLLKPQLPTVREGNPQFGLRPLTECKQPSRLQKKHNGKVISYGSSLGITCPLKPHCCHSSRDGWGRWDGNVSTLESFAFLYRRPRKDLCLRRLVA